MSALSTTMRFGQEGAGEPLRTNSLHAWRNSRKFTTGFEVSNVLLWMDGMMHLLLSMQRKAQKTSHQRNELIYAAMNTGRKIEKVKASKNDTRKNPTRRIFTKSVNTERYLLATRGLANVRRMERLEDSGLLFGTRKKCWRNAISACCTSNEQTKNNTDTNYLNREGLQMFTWKNVEGSTKASIFIWIKTRTMQIRKKPII